MVKRYIGGLISSTAPVMGTSGFFNTGQQLQRKNSNNWPLQLPYYQISASVYDATSLPAVSYISELTSNSVLISLFPDSGYLKYLLKVNGAELPITVSYIKISSTILTQSAFSLFGQSLDYVDSEASRILPAANDDHDSLFMDADGRGVLSRLNTTSFNSGTWTKFAGTTTVVADNVIDNVVTYPVTSFIPAGGYAGTIVTFPLTNSAVWFNLQGSYKTNNFVSMAIPTAMITVFTNSPAANSLYTISDGVNSFVAGRYGVSAAIHCKVDLSTGIITSTPFNLAVAPVMSNATEEDAIGCQLFTVDCYNTFCRDTIMYYGGSTHWLNPSNYLVPYGKSTFIAGSGLNQTGLDIFGSVDPVDRSVWFADWGHDGGGLFNVRDDIELGTRKTNIKLIPTNYTN